MSNMKVPTRIYLHKISKKLVLEYADKQFELSGEFLRIHSPSAEVRGHGRGQEVLQYGKQNIGIEQIEPVGNYALKFKFRDGHDTGIYTWDYLFDLGINREKYWGEYLQKLHNAGKCRDSDVSVVNIQL
ncbi:MAG: DUF971 domain-containing protein [Motiliproteus sp.]